MKTWVKKALASNVGTNVGSGIIPTGMKRFITYIRANKQDLADASACHIHLAEVSVGNPTLASAVSATNMKYVVAFATGASSSLSAIEIGQPGSVNPVLSIAGGMYAGVSASGVTTDLVVQYYDE